MTPQPAQQRRRPGLAGVALALALAALVLAACETKTHADLTGLATEAPGAARLIQGAAVMADGYRLPLKTWRPDGPPTRALLALHGFNSYHGALENAGAWFAERGYVVYAYDQRGFGMTVGRGVWPGDAALVGDAAAVIGLLQARHPDVPLTVFGQGMGAAVAVAALGEVGAPQVDTLILSSPMVRGAEGVGRPPRWALAALRKVPYPARSLGLREGITDDPDFPADWAANPNYVKDHRLENVDGLVDLMDRAIEAAPQAYPRTFIAWGAQNGILAGDGVEVLMKRLPRLPRLVVYPDGYHLLVRDTQHAVVLRDVHSFIERPLAAVPSGHANRASDRLLAGARPNTAATDSAWP